MSVDLYLPTPLPISTYLAAIESDSARIAEITRSADTSTLVSTCGEWTIRDLVRHVGFVHRWATIALSTASQPDRSAVEMPASDDQLPLAAWFVEGSDNLVAALSNLDPDVSTWHPFPPPQIGAVWFRRMAHETAIHRIDAELAAGHSPDLNPVLASDGIDEYLSLTLPHLLASGRVDLPTTSLHLHCTDVDGEWLVNNDDGLTLRREHAKGDAAVRGPAAAILADLWGRRGTLGDVDIIGDPATAEAWLSIGGN